MNSNEEKSLRENIRHLIRYVKQSKSNEENQLREVIRGFLNHELTVALEEASTPDVDPTPNKSTGINVLEELLKKIIPVLQVDYKSLTTSDEQRKSFRAHIINAVISTLTPARINTQAGQDEEANLTEAEMDEEVEIKIGDETVEDDDKFIDIRSDAEKAAEEEEADDPRKTFGADLEGDETGRNMAFNSFKKIETSIIDSYELLSNEEDQELFYDYIIANLKLYFDKFENELAGVLEEPTNQAYDMAKSEEEMSAAGPMGSAEELELEL
jgi:hypothetical protein